MRVLAITGLFPRPNQPALGIFILERLRGLARRGVEVRVVAPLPYVPPGPVPARYARMRATPAQATVHGLDVHYPRYPMLPKIGTRWQAAGYARGIRRVVRRLIDGFAPDVIDTHYLYPDACGAGRVARDAGIPYVCSARGSDVHTLARIDFVGEQIRGALSGAAAVIAVSNGLAEAMRRQQLVDAPIEVIPNGVDPERFHPRSRSASRAQLGLPAEGNRIVCVGNLVPLRGQDLLLRAMAHADAPAGLTLHLIGDGPCRAELGALARDLDIADRVVFEGAVPHDRIPDWFAASNGSIQLSESAGSPNAVLESTACGIPVLASDIPEMREALPTPDAGIVVAREVAAVARALGRLPEMTSVPSDCRTWDDVASEVHAVLERAVRTRFPSGGSRTTGELTRG